MLTFSRRQHTIWQIIVFLIILINIYWLKISPLGIIFGILYLWNNSKKIADIFCPTIHKGLKYIIGLLIILAYISINYTIAYHLYQINIWVFLWVFASLPIIIEILSYKYNALHCFFSILDSNPFRLSNLKSILLPSLVIILDAILLVVLLKKAGLGVIRSPWELLGYKFWAVFTISNILLVASFVIKKVAKNIFLVIWHLLLIVSLGIILYPLGFGYDSFIHQAVLETIDKTGTIEPRLFLYVGQYGLTFFLHHLSQLPLATVNKILLPILFSLIWPSSVYYGLRYGLNWSFQASYLATLWSFFMGFGFAVMTTPQSLAYLLVALIIFILPEINKKTISLYFVWLISFMALTIHPLGGIPLFYLAWILSVLRLNKKFWFKKPLYYLSLLISAISLPAFLALYQRIGNVPWNRIFNINLKNLITWPAISWHQTYNFTLDLIHNIGDNGIWLFSLITLVGLYLIIHENKYIFFKRHFIFIALLIINYLLVKIFIVFDLQIAYQKDDYVNRIAYLIFLSMMPIFLTAVYFGFKKILKNNVNIWQKTWLVILTVIIMTVGIYFTYPLYDQHSNSKSFNVTTTDLKTVDLIEENSQGQPYIVLANQMVGAAAINKFGFAHYYNDNFYYSMPLGINNIYQNYLTMIEKSASREQALEAMNQAGVDKLYFVVNNYWHSAKTAIQQAQETADEQFLVDNGVNNIFVYIR
ncbi:MAG: hypothetical protein COV55_00680 [Candidatus Komeilibacteria bacterium CG11_big_fil_rev_8_21_14_0_20_36_20]|uniref:Glycosyltransferase RgtA/B/C/D-like domain-containing protein n=1 Tax=Candidatus Komeilibacteria bacterium CG11_big_fil_rev_8_21_14_0_20_36_20 TaxID=1974477 RepID=A0A2H0NFS3_9BACT|nr:MAG: hypothetical protein COV55_00680 [Candidatus Komeilibacteria bacterium CG11_big_fil_rev_8_21_14_0_20_36_20]PIR81297.1 MAG: hypothetical protein COU21_03650 [Candidatus Komeilibacteria bacterium CG10_big_fil_rev_8_21_14_0_10_36_65]